jgi:hypothetical protein
MSADDSHSREGVIVVAGANANPLFEHIPGDGHDEEIVVRKVRMFLNHLLEQVQDLVDSVSLTSPEMDFYGPIVVFVGV